MLLRVVLRVGVGAGTRVCDGVLQCSDNQHANVSDLIDSDYLSIDVDGVCFEAPKQK